MTDRARAELSKAELSYIQRRLASPFAIQAYLDSIPYNLETEGETLRSPRRVLRDRTANCIEGAILAAAALRVAGRPPLIMDLTAEHDDDHVIALFREGGRIGAIATSKFAGLRYREPVYRSLRELAMSYFEDYYNLAGERTLGGYGRPVSLARFDPIGWMTSEEDLWPIAEYLERISHTSLLGDRRSVRLHRLDSRSKKAGMVGYPRA